MTIQELIINLNQKFKDDNIIFYESHIDKYHVSYILNNIPPCKYLDEVIVTFNRKLDWDIRDHLLTMAIKIEDVGDDTFRILHFDDY